MSEQCDVEDILCQIEALQSMRTLRTALGNESFRKEFPELETLEPKLIGKISLSEGNIREALARCGNIDLEDAEATKEFIAEVAEEIEEEEG